MSFIGLVTRKEKRNGAYLQAKVIAPNKALAKTANFKVTVEPTSIDDYTLCVIDNARARARINIGAVDVTDVQGDLNDYLIKVGLNKTITEYTFYNISSGNLKFSDYMTSEGKMVGRPKYGEGDVSGSLELRTYKKDVDGNITAEVTTHITLIIKSLTADQVLDSEEFTKKAIWNKMVEGTSNDNYDAQGYLRVRDNLNMPTGYTSKYLKNGDTVSVTWQVTDSLQPSTPRISDSGIITSKLSYTDASTQYNTFVSSGKSSECQFLKNSQDGDLCYSFYGLSIKCTIGLGTETREIEFEKIGMQSEYVTNQEICSKLYDKLSAVISTGGTYMFQGQTGNANPTGTVITAENTSIIMKTNSAGIAIPEFQIDGTSFSPITQNIDYALKTADGLSPYTNILAINGYKSDSDHYKVDITKSNLLTDADKDFCIVATITVNRYAGNVAFGKTILRLQLTTV